MTGGSWTVTRAVNVRWDAAGLTAAFTAYWPAGEADRYVALTDAVAPANTPRPYCVLEQGDEVIVHESSGKTAGTLQRVLYVPITFTIHTIQLNDSPAKEIARTLAQLIVEAYGGQPLQVDDDRHIRTELLTDRPGIEATEDETEVTWILRYRIHIDRTYNQPAY